MARRPLNKRPIEEIVGRPLPLDTPANLTPAPQTEMERLRDEIRELRRRVRMLEEKRDA